MAFLVSPGVQVKEIDLTNVVPAVSTSTGALAGAFKWGPVNEITLISSEEQLVQIFGQSSTNTSDYFLNAAQFLSYGNSLRVVRVVDETAAVNATVSGTGILSKNDDHFETLTITAADYALAKYPGSIGNSVGVAICSDQTAFSGWAFEDAFNSAPGTSDSVAAVGGSNDEMHVVVFDNDGQITGAANTVLETYSYVSQAIDAKTSDGSTNYWRNVINNQSAYIKIGDAPVALTDEGLDSAGQTFTTVANSSDNLSGGAGANANVGLAELVVGYDLFGDAETVDVSLLIQSSSLSGADSITLANHLISIASDRKDCVAFVAPPEDATVGNTNPLAAIKTWRDSVTSSSYAFAHSGAIQVYDKYNDTYRHTNGAGSMAGLCANADNVADPWFSPAGMTRGNVHNVNKLAYNPTQAHRDDLYKIGINPVVSFPGQGTMLYGDKTLQSKPSAFDRINVRRLFIVLEKSISNASKASLFEFNDEFTRAQFRNMVEPFLRDVKGRRGVTDFKVVCDETNNTGNVIDTNRFVADIYIKPARSINFITLNFIATRTGVEFSEIAGGN